MGSNTNGGLTKHVANGFARSDVLLDESELVIPEELLDAGRGWDPVAVPGEGHVADAVEILWKGRPGRRERPRGGKRGKYGASDNDNGTDKEDGNH